VEALVTIIDPLGHVALMRDGFDYSFLRGPEALHQAGEARRALFRKFQEYPANSVQGAGQLVRSPETGMPAEPWRVTQSAQVWQRHVTIQADLLGGGFEAGQLVNQPLINTAL
jgi:hypothetical protein